MNFTQMGIYAIASSKRATVQALTPSQSVILCFFLERFTCAPLATASLNTNAYATCMHRLDCTWTRTNKPTNHIPLETACTLLSQGNLQKPYFSHSCNLIQNLEILTINWVQSFKIPPQKAKEIRKMLVHLHISALIFSVTKQMNLLADP